MRRCQSALCERGAHIKPKNKPDAGECDLSGEARKAGARDRAGTRETEVLVDDDDVFIRPAELASFVGERVLPAP